MLCHKKYHWMHFQIDKFKMMNTMAEKTKYDHTQKNLVQVLKQNIAKLDRDILARVNKIQTVTC